MFIFLKDNMVSKADLASDLSALEMRLRGEMQDMKHELQTEMYENKNDIMSHMDYLVKQSDDTKTELAAINQNYKRHDRQLQQLADHCDITLVT